MCEGFGIFECERHIELVAMTIPTRSKKKTKTYSVFPTLTMQQHRVTALRCAASRISHLAPLHRRYLRSSQAIEEVHLACVCATRTPTPRAISMASPRGYPSPASCCHAQLTLLTARCFFATSAPYRSCRTWSSCCLLRHGVTTYCFRGRSMARRKSSHTAKLDDRARV